MGDAKARAAALSMTPRAYIDLLELIGEAKACNEAQMIFCEHDDINDDGLGRALYFVNVEMRKRLAEIESVISGEKEADDAAAQ